VHERIKANPLFARGVRGPVDFWALWWLASTSLGEGLRFLVSGISNSFVKFVYCSVDSSD
jgi:hypothetical protein